MSYGLPPGSSITYGSPGFPAWVYELADAFNLKASTYPGHQESDRRGEAGFAPNPTRLNRGIDWSGSVDDMQRFADYLMTIKPLLEQVIWENQYNGRRAGVAGGKDVTNTGYYQADFSGHRDHVHSRQSQPLPIPGKMKKVPQPRYTELDYMTGGGRSPRSRKPINFLLHTQEGDGSAESLARYCNGDKNVSYHYTLRDGILCAVVDTDYASWSVLDANAYTVNLCYAGSYAGWSREQWLRRERDIAISAWVAVQDCRKYGIPTEVIAPPYGKPRPGISDHKYVTKALGIGTHTDVGNAYPWDVFTSYVRKYATGETAADNNNTDLEDFMPALSDAEQREVLDLLRILAKVRFPSRSPLRHLGEGPVDTVAGIDMATDGNVHVLVVKSLAEAGVQSQIDLLNEIANADPARYPERQEDAKLARAILASIEAKKSA